MIAQKKIEAHTTPVNAATNYELLFQGRWQRRGRPEDSGG